MAFLRARGENVKEAAEAAVVVRPHPRDVDVAGVVVEGDELNTRQLLADARRDVRLVRQDDLAVLVEPADLADSFPCHRGDVAAEHEGVTGLCGQAVGGYDLT